MQITDNVSLRDISWFKTGGVTEYYGVCETLDELLFAIDQSQKLGVPYRVIGESTNVLMSDSGFPGFVIKNRTSSIVFMHDRSQVIADAGVPLSLLLTRASSVGYSGLEFLAGIPGTVGGAVYSNSGAIDSYIGDYVRSATLLFVEGAEVSRESIRRVGREWFEFSPYESKLKRMQTPIARQPLPVILSVTLQLSRMNHATCLERVNSVLQSRREILHVKIPILQAFSNIQRTTETRTPPPRSSSRALLHPIHYIDKNNIRQWRKGNIAAFLENPNFMANHGNGTSREAAELIEQIKQEIGTEKQPVVSPLEYLGLWE